MRAAERNLNRLLDGLRAAIVRSGMAQGEIEEALGWAPAYTEELLCRREKIAMAELVAILNVIGVEPADFFAEVFPPDPRPKSSPGSATP